MKHPRIYLNVICDVCEAESDVRIRLQPLAGEEHKLRGAAYEAVRLELDVILNNGCRCPKT